MMTIIVLRTIFARVVEISLDIVTLGFLTKSYAQDS